MKITNQELVLLSNVLHSLNNKKVPFALTVSKNVKIVNMLIDAYNQKRSDIFNDFATLDEKGNILGKLIPDQKEGEEKRFENPQNIEQMEIEDNEGLIKNLTDLGQAEIEIDLLAINMSKSYYDSVLKEKVKVEHFIDTNLEPELIGLLDKFELISI